MCSGHDKTCHDKELTSDHKQVRTKLNKYFQILQNWNNRHPMTIVSSMNASVSRNSFQTVNSSRGRGNSSIEHYTLLICGGGDWGAEAAYILKQSTREREKNYEKRELYEPA